MVFCPKCSKTEIDQEFNSKGKSFIPVEYHGVDGIKDFSTNASLGKVFKKDCIVFTCKTCSYSTVMDIPTKTE